MKLFYHALLAGAMLLPAAAPTTASAASPRDRINSHGASLRNHPLSAPMKVSATELLADPEGTVLSGRFDETATNFTGYKCSDQGRPGFPMKFLQAFHGCTKSINAVRVIGLFNYFNAENIEWLGCQDRPGINESNEMTKPVCFEVSFYRMDEDGMPGECVYKKEFDLIGRFTGVEYGMPDADPLYEFIAELGEDVKLESGYMSFSAADKGDNPSCWFSVFTADSSMDWGLVDVGDGEYWSSNPCIFSFLGSGEDAARKALKISKIKAPLTDANGSHEIVKATLQNVGADPISDIKLQLWADGRLISTEEPGFILESGRERDYSFACRVDCASIGTHEIKVVNVTPGDEGISLNVSKTTTTSSEPGEYCGSGAIYSDDEIGITRVTFGTVDNQSEASPYSDFTSVSADILPGETLRLDAEPKEEYLIGAWIDWNGDGLFSGLHEFIGYIYEKDKDLEIRIPDDIYVAEGGKRLRLVMTSSNDPAPCGEYYFGETEDYIINVTRPSDSPAVSASISEVEASVNHDAKNISLDIINDGSVTLTGALSADYVISPVYEDREINASLSKNPLRIDSRKNTLRAPEAERQSLHTLRYDKGMDNCISISNYETGSFGQYWPAEYMTSLSGMEITSIDVYIGDAPETSSVCIYNMSEEGTTERIYTQPFTAVENQWNHVELTTPVKIDGKGILYGVEISMTAGKYHIGMDELSATAGYGDLCNVGDENWWSMADLGMDHNVCIRANLGGERPKALNWLSIDKENISVGPNGKETITVKVDGKDMNAGVHEARITVRSNDALTPAYGIPVYMVNGIVAGIDTNAVYGAKVDVADGKIRISSDSEIVFVECCSVSGLSIKADKESYGYSIDLSSFSNGIYAVGIWFADGHKESMKVAIGR